MEIPFIDIHTHHQQSLQGILQVHSLFLQEMDLSKDITVPFTAGIHPWHADRVNYDEVQTLLMKLGDQSQLLALGETGLDKKCPVNFSVQRMIFELHLAFAVKMNLPIIIHNIGGWNEMYGYIKKSEIPFIFHAYQGKAELSRQLVSGNCFFSVGKFVTSGLRSVSAKIKGIPAERLFLETDDDEVSIAEIYTATACILRISLNELKERIYSNYTSVFNQKRSAQRTLLF